MPRSSRSSRGRVTSRDIAREAGVSQPTVSRALRGDARVAPATAALVQATARRLGYVPNAAARSLSTRRTSTVAVVVADIANPFYPELVDAVHRELGRMGYRTVLLSERSDVGAERGIARLLRDGAVDGAIVATATTDARSRELVTGEPIPLVLLNRELDDAGRDVVVSDNAGGAALAAELLVELGHERIATIGGPAETSTARDRDAGFATALRRLGKPIAPELIRGGDYSHRSGHQWALELLAQAEPPTAIFCGNDVIALGALDAARRLGVDVPGELSVVGFDDIPLAGWESFQLTTVSQPLAEMAGEAARMLVERIEADDDPPPRRVAFPTRIVTRRSTGRPPGR
jgi:LacI family transcriptional regulator